MNNIDPSPIKAWHLVVFIVVVVLALTCGAHLEART